MPTFPSSIRPPLAEGFSETPAATVISSQADVGPGKSRVRSTAVKADISLVYQMTSAEYAAFKTFYDSDLSYGTLSFQWSHPLTGVSERVRISGGYTASPRGASGLWRVSFSIKVLR